MALVSMAQAQIQYTIDGGTPAALPANRVINVGTLTNPITTLHIFDSSGVDDSIVGQVEIQGTATSQTALHIKVVNQADTSAFVEGPTFQLSPGLRDFGGLTFSNTALRDRSIVAVSVRGDVTGDIDIGQVWRIDAQREPENTFGGFINGNITAHKPNGAVIANADSIGYVRASVGITGDITAKGVHEEDSNSQGYLRILEHGSIGRIIVGPIETDSSNPSGGVQGDIVAEDGSIGSIYTTGWIGGDGNTPNIWAGDGIREIRAISEVNADDPNTASVLGKNFTANIKANAEMLRISSINPANYVFTSQSQDGALHLLETTGNYTGGRIDVGNIGCNEGCGGTLATSCERSGIYIKGSCDAYIYVSYDVLWANVVAGNFLKDVVIGRFMKGSVVAMGLPDSGSPDGFSNGIIESISVGYAPLPTTATNAYKRLGVGLCGLDSAPYTPSSPDRYFDPREDFGYNHECTATDGLIRAHDRIGTCAVKAVGLEFQPLVAECKTYAPRIEAPLILGSLTIDDFRAGAVWSGRLGSSTTYDEFYAEIHNVNVGCMSPHARVWMRDWAYPTETYAIADFGPYVLGEIHVPYVPANAAIRIGRSLANVEAPPFTVDGQRTDALCECWPLAGEVESCLLCEPVSSFEQSPRTPAFPWGICSGPRRGKVWIKNDQGLQGQIIINGEAAPDAAALLWSGEVDLRQSSEIPSCPLDQIAVIQPWTSGYRGPYYGWPSANVGGGAVGLVPYRLYAYDCEPRHYNDWHYDADQLDWPTCADDVLINSRFNDEVTLPDQTVLAQQTAKIRFYGPVYTLAPEAAPIEEQPYRVFYWISAEPRVFWADVTEAFTVTLNRSASGAVLSREVVVSHRDGAGPVSEGFYAVVFNTQEREPEVQPRYPLYCDGTTASPPPAPRVNVNGTVGYYFRIYPDCNGDGCIDAEDARCSDFVGFCPADLDNDGDYDNGGTTDNAVSVDDLIYFLAAFEAGDIAADLSSGLPGGEPDNAVDINDLLFFLIHFEAGC